jgi:hypothetical protein
LVNGREHDKPDRNAIADTNGDAATAHAHRVANGDAATAHAVAHADAATTHRLVNEHACTNSHADVGTDHSHPAHHRAGGE